MKKIGIKFCGNCNPDLDLKELISKIVSKGDWEISYGISEDCDLILCLNGCASSCLEEIQKAEKVIFTGGANFQGKKYNDSDELAANIAKSIKELIMEENNGL